uniref:Fibronectin type III domain containing 4a n=1 Tax=Oryzias sinensis TaxID=183150 RepID=A0A8C7YC09_9TELE
MQQSIGAFSKKVVFLRTFLHGCSILCHPLIALWIDPRREQSIVQSILLLSISFCNNQRQDGHMQRFIREVNTTSRSCVLWDLEEETDYIIQVQSIGLYGESQASKKIHFRTLKKTDRFPSNSSNQDDPTVQGLDKSRHLQTGEMIIIVVVLLMWAAVIALFCRQYDIIKDNDSSNNKEKVKPSSERSTPEHHSGGLLRSKFHPSVPSINIIEV